MPKKYEVQDIFDVKGIKKFLTNTNKELLKIEKTIRDIGKSKIIPKGDGADLQKVNKDLETLNKTRKESLNIQKEATKVTKARQKQLDKFSVKAQKAKLAEQELARETKNEARAQLALDKAQKKGIKTLQDLEKVTNALVKRRKQLDLTTKQGQRENKKLERQISKNTKTLKKYDKAIGRSFRNVGNYVGALKNLAGAFGIAFGARIVVDFFRDSLQGYEDQIIAETKLETVLKQRTGATTEQIDKIKQLTIAQQKQGVIGDEIQIAGAQQLSTFVGQTKSVETLIPAMNNLIAQQKGFSATQGDATNIANLMGKALQGQTGALTRVGISFTEAQGKILKYGTEQEKAAILAEVITNNVGEMNKSLAETPLGKMKQLGNVFGDLKERIGGLVAGVLFRFANLISDILDILSGPNGLTDAFNVIGDSLNDFIEPFSQLIDLFSDSSTQGNVLKGIIDGLGGALKAITAPLRALIEWNRGLIQEWKRWIRAGRSVLEMMGILSKEERLRQEERDKLLKEEAARQKQIEERNKKLEELRIKQAIEEKARQEEAAKLAEKNKKLSAERKKRQDEELKQQDKLTKSANDLGTALGNLYLEQLKINKLKKEAEEQGAKDTFDIAVANFEKEQALRRQENAQYESSEASRTAFAKEQSDELFLYRTQKEIEYLQFLQSRIDDQGSAEAAGLASQIEILRAGLAEFKNEVIAQPEGVDSDQPFSIWGALGLDEKQSQQANEILAGAKSILTDFFDLQIQKYTELADASRSRIADIEKELNEEKKKDDEGAASRVDSLKKKLAAEKEVEKKAEQEREKAARRKKQLAITEAIISTAVGVVNALNTQPSILGIILAAIVASAGAIQISKIKSSKFAEGTDYVQLDGNKPGIDTVPSMLTAGEGVIEEDVNKKIPYKKGFKRWMIPAAAEMFLDGKNSFNLQQKNVNFANNKIIEKKLSKSNELLEKISLRPIDIFNKEGKRVGYRIGENTYYTG